MSLAELRHPYASGFEQSRIARDAVRANLADPHLRQSLDRAVHAGELGVLGDQPWS